MADVQPTTEASAMTPDEQRRDAAAAELLRLIDEPLPETTETPAPEEPPIEMSPGGFITEVVRDPAPDGAVLGEQDARAICRLFNRAMTPSWEDVRDVMQDVLRRRLADAERRAQHAAAGELRTIAEDVDMDDPIARATAANLRRSADALDGGADWTPRPAARDLADAEQRGARDLLAPEGLVLDEEVSPAQQLRSILRANLMDGDEGGSYTQSCRGLLDDVVSLVVEDWLPALLAAARAEREDEVPVWLLDLVGAAQEQAEGLGCNGDHEGDDGCDACAWEDLARAVPPRIRRLVAAHRRVAS